MTASSFDVADALDELAASLRSTAARLRQDADDDQRRSEEGDEQRDYAEERANRDLLRDEPVDVIGEDPGLDERMAESDLRRAWVGDRVIQTGSSMVFQVCRIEDGIIYVKRADSAKRDLRNPAGGYAIAPGEFCCEWQVV